MKHLLLTTIAAVLVVGCGESQQSAPAPESKPVESVAEAATPEPPTAKAPDISIHEATYDGNIEAVKQHIAAGTDVNAKDKNNDFIGWTPLLHAASDGHKEITELLINNGADLNVKDREGLTPLHYAVYEGHKEVVALLIAKGADVNPKNKDDETPLDWPKRHPEIADLLRKHGGKTGEELKAEGK